MPRSWPRLRAAVLAREHENHERLEEGCLGCDYFFAEMERQYGRPPRRPTREEEEIDAEGLAMREREMRGIFE